MYRVLVVDDEMPALRFISSIIEQFSNSFHVTGTASSGELARIMLAIKSALAHKDSTPLLVFDEIDANVGGEVARAVGFKMQQLGNRHQVISITHFPQVAALASHHYLVQKASAGNRTISCLREVSHEDRIDELVRMLGGGGDHARTLAQALLQPS